MLKINIIENLLKTTFNIVNKVLQYFVLHSQKKNFYVNLLILHY